MAKNSADAKKLASLRDELLARNEVERLQRRGEPASPSLKARLRESSLQELLQKIENYTAIPGGESRVELFSSNPAVRDVGASVALVCSRLDLQEPTAQQKNWELNTIRFLCKGQNFYNEPGLPSRFNTPATGFLVGSSGRYILTAKHVAVDNLGRLMPGLYCVFGYRIENSMTKLSFSPADVIPVRSLVEWGRGFNEDWALVELEFSSGRSGLPLRTSDSPSVSDPVIAIGYPHGLPVKTGTGVMRDVNPSLYQADLDVGAGNSGSPMIAVDANGIPLHVEGIVVSGLYDLQFVEAQGCAIWLNACDATKPECWAGVVPISKVIENPVFRATVYPS